MPEMLHFQDRPGASRGETLGRASLPVRALYQEIFYQKRHEQTSEGGPNVNLFLQGKNNRNNQQIIKFENYSFKFNFEYFIKKHSNDQIEICN